MRLFAASLLVSFFLAAPLYAGAWTQAAGKGIAIVNSVYYSADKFWNNDGDKQSQAKYSKYELNPYFEYGLTDDFTIGANLSLQRVHQDTSPAQSNWGLGDSEIFLRARLLKYNGFVLSAEPMLKLASPASSDDFPMIGGQHSDIGLGLSMGYGFSAFGQNHFASLDTSYRYRFGIAQNQYRVAATLGVGITPEWTIMPQVFGTFRERMPENAVFTQSSGDDYNLVKLQLSAVYKASDDISLQFGGFTDVTGKNTGAGNGLLFSVWKNF